MRGIIPTLIISLFMTAAFVPGVQAETRVYSYDLAFNGIVYDVCFDINTVGELIGYDQLDEDVCGLNGGQLNIGGIQAAETPPAFSGVVISALDDVGGTPYIVGAYSETGPAEGGFTNPAFDAGCGPIVSTERESDYLNVFVYMAEVTDDLEVCLGSRGTVTMDYF